MKEKKDGGEVFLSLKKRILRGIIQGLLFFSIGVFFWIIADSLSALGLGIALFFIGLLTELDDADYQEDN